MMIFTSNINNIHSLSYGPAVRSALISAQYSIYINLYVTSFNIRKKNDFVYILFIILQKQLAAGLDIRFIIDHPRKHKTNYHATKFLIRRLQEWHFPFWIAPPRTTCHAKIILIDHELCFLGSHNLTKSSLRNPLEMSIETSDPSTCFSISKWFDKNFIDPGFEFYPPGEYNISDIYP